MSKLPSPGHDEDTEVRYKTIEALGAVKGLTDPLITGLVQLSVAEDAKIRKNVVSSLAAVPIENLTEINLVLKAFGDIDPTVRLSAIKTATKIDSSVKCPTHELLQALDSNPEEIQIAAIDALKASKCEGSAAIPSLIRLSQTSSAPLKLDAVQAIGLVGDAETATDFLIDLAVQDGDAKIRAAALFSIAADEVLSDEQLTRLASIVRDPIVDVRQSLAYALIFSGGHSDKSQELLVTELRDRDESVRESVARALEYGKAGQKLFQIAAKALADKSDSVRYYAAASILKLGTPNETKNQDQATTDNFLDDDDLGWFVAPDSRWPAELVNSSILALSDPDRVVRQTMVEAIASFHVDDKGIRLRLSQMATSDAATQVRSAAIKALTDIQLDSPSLNSLLQATRDKDEYVRLAAVNNLARLSGERWPYSGGRKNAHDRESIQLTLASALGDSGPDVQVASAKVIAKLTEKLSAWDFPHSAAISMHLRELAKSDDSSVRTSAVTTLGGMRGATRLDQQTIIAALRDPSMDVEIAATTALRNMSPTVTTVEQAVGLRQISLFDLTTSSEVVAETKVELRSIDSILPIIDALSKVITKPVFASLGPEAVKALSGFTTQSNAVVNALQTGRWPEDLVF